jgi:hypothetical protein
MANIEKSKFVLNLDTSHLPIEGADTAAFIAVHLRAVADQLETEPGYIGMYQDIQAHGGTPDYPAGQFANKPHWYLEGQGA